MKQTLREELKALSIPQTAIAAYADCTPSDVNYYLDNCNQVASAKRPIIQHAIDDLIWITTAMRELEDVPDALTINFKNPVAVKALVNHLKERIAVEVESKC